MTDLERIKFDLHKREDKDSLIVDYLDRHFPIPEFPVCGSIENFLGDRAFYLIAQPNISEGLPNVNILISASCTGQDSVINAMSEIGREPINIRTATTRKRRVEESEDAYVWMDRIEGVVGTNEVDLLIEKYGLVECQQYCNNLYGTPLESLREAAKNQDDKPIVLKNDQHGAAQIASRIKEEMNSIIVAMFPENYKQLVERVKSGRNDPISRLAEAAVFIIEYEDVSHYALVNREHSNSKLGAQITAHELLTIIDIEKSRSENENS